MRGIILAGGLGTRLYPLTKCISKQLLPVYNKPVIYYPLSTMMLAGIRDILIISTPRDLPIIEGILENGNQFGLNISYAVQEKPNGIAEAFLIGESFINSEPVCLLLGDNFFYGNQLSLYLSEVSHLNHGSCLFGYHVSNPQDFGVAEFDESGNVISLVEKPKNPKSNWAVTGMYFYDSEVVNYTKNLKPSARGELEITDLNNIYLAKNQLQIQLLGRGITWLDTGTFEGLLSASQFVQMIEERQGLKIACLEEIAFKKGWLSSDDIHIALETCPNKFYKEYLQSILVNQKNTIPQRLINRVFAK